jgi:hypothetical protein
VDIEKGFNTEGTEIAEFAEKNETAEFQEGRHEPKRAEGQPRMAVPPLQG